MGILELLLLAGVNMQIESFKSPRGLGTSWFIVETETGEPVEVFSSEVEARDALNGKRRPAERLVG